MNPQIEFKHVLGELSVNRNDPCEVLREMISNSYDADAQHIFYAPLNKDKGLIFADDGNGLSSTQKINGITPWEAFFSIGKSTKKKGESIGYKCQGSKLCFACSRILVATKINAKKANWNFKIIDNPRNNLDVNFDISPDEFDSLDEAIDKFFPSMSAETTSTVDALYDFILKKKLKTGTIIVIDGLDTEGYSKYFSLKKKIEESYVYNYIRFFTRHGDLRKLDKKYGFIQSEILQVSSDIKEVELTCYSNKKNSVIPHGFPYLTKTKNDVEIKSPAQVSRLRDGRFYSRAAKAFTVSGSNFSIIMAIDGNRRAHEEYEELDRKGKGKSGIRLADQRGLFISVNGIKICKHLEVLNEIEDYSILAEGDSSSHFFIAIEGDFDLVTNRNSLSKKAFDTLYNPDFLREVKKFFDARKANDRVFAELISRLKRESTESRLSEQIENLEASKNKLKERERFRISINNSKQLYISPLPGEEYLVGVLYASLYDSVPQDSSLKEYWKKVITFSTQGIDSLGLKDEDSIAPLNESNILSIEYKFEFNNNGPFNHAIAVVNYIIAWEVNLNTDKKIHDSFTCFGNTRKVPNNDFEWEIFDIENDDGSIFKNTVKVINLRKLIEATFKTNFTSR